ncbi:BF3164 family lipoprotein [Candidatus Palauibacter sp.]|uniref:BF3164 family lipoprotein n=1 Tax=Candidatus Palauibacter sp. TaxID=3101350 RepID=UPI003AF2C4D6
MRPSAISIVAILATLACRQAEPAPIDDKGATALAPDAFFADDSLGWIVEIGLVGDRVVALDAMLQPAVHVVDFEMSRRLGAYGHRGDGPGEFKDPEQVVAGASNSPDEVWILDGVHQRLTRLSLHELEAGNVVSPETFLMDGPNAGALVRASDGKWFSGGWIRGGRVGRYHADRSYDRTIVGFPPDIMEAPGTTLPQAYESWVVADPEGGRLAAATLLGGLLEIFDHDGVRIAKAAVPDPFQPAWAQGRSRGGKAVMAVGPETRYGFTDLAATQRYLYGVFSGRRVDEDGPVWASREVQVYTWDGAYVKTLHLDRAAEAIAIDASDTWLYASGPEPTPWIGRFRLREPRE